MNLFCLFVIPVKLVLDCDRGTGIHSRRDRACPCPYKKVWQAGTETGFPVSSTGQALLESIPAKAGTGMTYKKDNFSSWSKYGAFKLYFNKNEF